MVFPFEDICYIKKGLMMFLNLNLNFMSILFELTLKILWKDKIPLNNSFFIE